MARAFSAATAEQVVAVVQAVGARDAPADVAFVADYCDLQHAAASAALDLAVDLGYLEESAGSYEVLSPLCRFARTPAVTVRAAVLRVALESYEPFRRFRTELEASGNASMAAERTRVLLGLAAHRDEILTTLVSLGTFAQALSTTGGGGYKPDDSPIGDPMVILAAAAADQASAEATVRDLIGGHVDSLSRDHVLEPLADALLKAAGLDGRSAVTLAGNAVESMLSEVASRVGVNVAGKHGIIQKTDAFSSNLPKKVRAVGYYLGSVRNAADHGIDPDIAAAWQVRDRTGAEYVSVACSFIRCVLGAENGDAASL